MKTKKHSFTIRSRAESYRMLSACYFPPDDDLLKGLRDLVPSDGNVCLELAESLPQKDALKILRVDFSRLFVGPFRLSAPPYGSVYLDADEKLLGNSTLAVSECYKKEELDVAMKEIPDHIAIELEFMHYLAGKEIRALESKDNEAARQYKEKQFSFISKYLASWVGEFTNLIKKNANTEFYTTLAETTLLFIQDDVKFLVKQLGC